MGKFDGIIICTDLDDTLLKDDKTVSEANKEAILRFMSEGGKFTYATGRILNFMNKMFKHIIPNAPIICCNGAMIYDAEEDRIIWERHLSEGYKDVISDVLGEFPDIGVEVCTKEGVNFINMNHLTHNHALYQNINEVLIDLTEVTDRASKVMFMRDGDKMHEVEEYIKNKGYHDEFYFIKSEPYYLEMLPYNTGKGKALIKLAEIMGIDKSKTVGIGNYENDLSLVEEAGVGVAVANAISCVLEKADYITADNNHDALSELIGAIEEGKIRI